MVVTLYGNPISTCTKRIATILEETNTPYKFVVVDFGKGEHKAPEFLAKQPFGQVPYLDDDGFIVYESRAIARYIAAKAKSPLLPTGDAQKVALFEQAASIEVSNFEPYASVIMYQRVFAPMMGAKTDEARVTELTKALDGKMVAYEAILSKQKYLAGDELTLADLFHLPHGVFLAPQKFNFLEDEARFPHVARWWKELISRPSWQAVKDGVST